MESVELNNKFWKNKKILITGHSGFKGSWLFFWLYMLGSKVHGLSSKGRVSNPDIFTNLFPDGNKNDYRLNITNYDNCLKLLVKIKPEIVFHLAAQPIVSESYQYPLKTFNTNIIGTANILEASFKSGSVKSVVVITSDKCYENIESNHSYIETDKLGGWDPYSSSKACAEIISSSYYKSFMKPADIGLATARAGNVIGGGDWSKDRLIPDAIRSWVKEQELVVRNPNSIRPWQHVLDPIYGYLLLAEKLYNNFVKFSGPWNFGPSKEGIQNVNQIIKLCQKEWNGYCKYRESNLKSFHEANLLQLDRSKSNLALNWIPKYSSKKAVSETINWYREYYYENIEVKELMKKQIVNYENYK